MDQRLLIASEVGIDQLRKHCTLRFCCAVRSSPQPKHGDIALNTAKGPDVDETAKLG